MLTGKVPGDIRQDGRQQMLENACLLCVRQLSNFRYRVERFFLEIALKRSIDE